MKRFFLVYVTLFALLVASCGGGDKKLNTQEQKAVEEQVDKDKQAMDSLEKAIQAQIDAVPEDSLMNQEH
jgi:hypothetical protein